MIERIGKNLTSTGKRSPRTGIILRGPFLKYTVDSYCRIILGYGFLFLGRFRSVSCVLRVFRFGIYSIIVVVLWCLKVLNLLLRAGNLNLCRMKTYWIGLQCFTQKLGQGVIVFCKKWLFFYWNSSMIEKIIFKHWRGIRGTSGHDFHLLDGVNFNGKGTNWPLTFFILITDFNIILIIICFKCFYHVWT